jgi:hypothetical protein
MTVTDDEALRLVPGDRLVGCISGRLAVVEAVFVGNRFGPRQAVRVTVRRVGKTRTGHPYPHFTRTADYLQRLPRPDAPAFHVAADWLDENGEPMAAAKLRQAFPLGGAG